MDKARVHYFRCPYCGKSGEHSQKVGKSVGLYRIKELYNNMLLLECQKCGKVCQRRTQGTTLRWEDMSHEARKIAGKKEWVKYTKEIKDELD